MAVKYLNPYAATGPKYTAGLDAVVAVLAPLYPNQTIDDIVDAVYDYVTTTYTITMGPVEQQNVKSLIYATINGYLNYQLFYNAQQTAFIHQLIGGTLACKNPEDIQQHILDVEEAIAQSNLTAMEQKPLLYATAVGKAAYTYWASVVTSPGPGGWSTFTTSFTPAIVKFPYWVAAGMQGVLIGLNTLNSAVDNQYANALQLLVDAKGADILLALFGSLAVDTGKVVFNLQQKFVAE